MILLYPHFGHFAEFLGSKGMEVAIAGSRSLERIDNEGLFNCGMNSKKSVGFRIA
jgi:hypothetical protein